MTEEELTDLKAVMKVINNGNGGKPNCAHVALRMDEILRDGPKANMPPISTANGNMHYQVRFSPSGEILKLEGDDPRLLERVLKERTQCPEVEDFTDERRVMFEIDVMPLATQKNASKLRLMKATHSNIIQQLQCLPRRKKDGSAHGFIILTYEGFPNIPKPNCHICNFFVDYDNTVYILDAQSQDERRWVRTTVPKTGYRDEVFFINSVPPEGFIPRVKTEVKIKEELIQTVPAVENFHNLIKKLHARYWSFFELLHQNLSKLFQDALREGNTSKIKFYSDCLVSVFMDLQTLVHKNFDIKAFAEYFEGKRWLLDPVEKAMAEFILAEVYEKSKLKGSVSITEIRRLYESAAQAGLALAQDAVDAIRKANQQLFLQYAMEQQKRAASSAGSVAAVVASPMVLSSGMSQVSRKPAPSNAAAAAAAEPARCSYIQMGGAGDAGAQAAGPIDASGGAASHAAAQGASHDAAADSAVDMPVPMSDGNAGARPADAASAAASVPYWVRYPSRPMLRPI